MIMKCDRYGCFYKVEEGTLYYCPMLVNGEPDYDWAEVSALPDEDDYHLTRINAFFGTKFTPAQIDKRHP